MAATFDGILSNFNEAFQDLIIKVTERDLFPSRPYDALEWDYVRPLGYTRQEETSTWNVIKSSRDFWATLPAYAGVDDLLERLEDYNVFDGDIYFITNRMGQQPKVQSEDWLMAHGYATPTVLVTPHKGRAAHALDLDAYIDDKPSNCIDVVKTMGLGCRTFLLDRSWNQNFNERHIERVSSVEEMLTKLGIEDNREKPQD